MRVTKRKTIKAKNKTIKKTVIGGSKITIEDQAYNSDGNLTDTTQSSIYIVNDGEVITINGNTYGELESLGKGSYGTVFTAHKLDDEGNIIENKKYAIKILKHSKDFIKETKNYSEVMNKITSEKCRKYIVGLIEYGQGLKSPTTVTVDDHSQGLSSIATKSVGKKSINLRSSINRSRKSEVFAKPGTNGKLASQESAKPYMVIEYDAKFIGLDKVLDQLSNDIKIKILHNLLEGIKCIHKNNIIHGDIKLDNILVDKDTGEIKYVDFGSTILLENKNALVDVVRKGDVKFKDQASKVMKNDVELGKALELWTLACLFCVIITGDVKGYKIITEDKLKGKHLTEADYKELIDKITKKIGENEIIRTFYATFNDKFTPNSPYGEDRITTHTKPYSRKSSRKSTVLKTNSLPEFKNSTSIKDYRGKILRIEDLIYYDLYVRLARIKGTIGSFTPTTI